MSFFHILGGLFQVLTMGKRGGNKETGDQENPQTKTSSSQGSDGRGDLSEAKKSSSNRSTNRPRKEDKYDNFFPPNYSTIVLYCELTMKALLVVLGLGISRIHKIKEKKRSHKWANQVMHELVNRSPQTYHLGPDKPFEVTASSDPETGQVAPEEKPGTKVVETPVLIAAKMGVAEVVEKILEAFPVAIQDSDSENKNVVLLAVENRQPHVYSLLLERKIMKESAFRQVDSCGNSALHLAAMAGGYRPWLIPGAALQMQWELKWYKFVKNSMPRNFFIRYNKKGETPKDLFKATHKDLVKSGSEWLSKTSESYSVVAALIATVAFSTSANIPGGVREDSGAPKLGNEPAFNIFAISSVVALCFSVTSLVFFLAILTSRFQERDFARDLPRKLLLGLTSLLTSIVSILISFCAGHFFVLGDKVRSAAYPIYAATCFPVTFFILAQLPLYFDLIRAILREVPQRSYKAFPH